MTRWINFESGEVHEGPRKPGDPKSKKEYRPGHDPPPWLVRWLLAGAIFILACVVIAQIAHGIKANS